MSLTELYGNLYETSGPGDGDGGGDGGGDISEEDAEVVAEIVADNIVEEEGTEGMVYESDTGFKLALPPLGQIVNKVGASASGLLRNLGLPVPNLGGTAKARVAKKVLAKLPTKVAKAAARRPAARPAPRPAPSRIGFGKLVQPVSGPPAVSRPVSSVKQLMARTTWAQLAGLTSMPVTLGIGATLATTIATTRTGWVLDWSTNNNNGEVLASNLTYAQQPNTIFSPTPLSNWGPAAANPSPIQPIYVTMPATFNVTLQNTNAGATNVITWQMSGIPAEHVMTAMMDPDIRDFLASVAPELARMAQAGGFAY